MNKYKIFQHILFVKNNIVVNNLDYDYNFNNIEDCIQFIKDNLRNYGVIVKIFEVEQVSNTLYKFTVTKNTHIEDYKEEFIYLIKKF